jgi:hypothetical protein
MKSLGWRKLVLVAAAVITALVAVPSQAGATGGNGFNRVTSPGASSQGVGYGLGWVGLSGPGVNDPIIGNLFFYDNSSGNAADHMDIFNAGYTYPRGWAYGQFNGCAYAYTFANFYLESGTAHSGNCTPYSSGMSKADLFCSSVYAGWPFDVRYITKNDQWVMGKVTGYQFAAPGAPAADLNWVFVPRGCI